MVSEVVSQVLTILKGGPETLTPGKAMSMSRNEVHVTPHPDGGWQVKKPGASRAIKRTTTQRDSIDRGRTVLGNDRGGEIVIHRPNGQIRDSDTVAPGNDPYPPKDTK